MASLNLLAVLFLSYFCFGDCAISLEQPSVLFAAVGSAVDLNCHLISDERLTRINLYWFRIGLNGTLKKYLYPPRAVPTGSSISGASSISLLHPNHSTDMSLSVSNLTLAHTDTYVCHVSLVVGMKNNAVSGSGTFLLVHEPLETSLNESDLTCATNVQTVTDVTLVWQHENVTLGDPGRLANSDHSYWISNTFPNSTSLCISSQNLTFTCHLQYKGTTVSSKRMKVTCAGLAEAHQPILLYSLILGSSLLILLVLLLVWIRNKWIFRTNPDSSLYTNISDLKRSYCL